MSVYVDDAFIQASVPNGSRTHTSKWCHMTADTTEELVTFAKRIGLRPSWIQKEGTPYEHFDVTMPKRRAAVKAGAIEITWREGVYQVEAKQLGKTFDVFYIREGLDLLS